MSSSSSIAAARRRRAGGSGGPTPQSRPVQQQQPSTSTNSNGPVNPLTILQQHHIKINKLEQIIQKIISKDTDSSSLKTGSSSSSMPTDINIDEIGDLIMAKVEQQLDLKAFYDNDERLMTEIEGLKGIIQTQQLVINGFNNTLYKIVDKLNINTHVLDETNNNEDISPPTFPKSVIIDEANNSIKEFIASELQEDNTNSELNGPNDSFISESVLDA